MKKIAACFMLVVGVFAGCTTKQDERASTETTVQTTISTIENNFEFSNGILQAEDFKLSYVKSEIVKSPSEEGYGLYVTYSLTNESDGNIIPADIVDTYVLYKQESETSLITLDNTYYSLDAFGTLDDVKTYNEQVEKENSGSNELLPKKTVEIIESYSLNNLNYPVEMIANVEGEQIGSYKIDLTDLQKPEENISLSEDNTEESSTPEQSIVSDMPASWTEGEVEWEKAKEQGWTAEDWEAAVYASKNETYVVESSELPEGTSENARQIYNEIKNIKDRELTSGEIQTLEAIEQGYFE